MKSGNSSLLSQYPFELKLFRSVVLFSLLTCCFLLSSAQTTLISGIVNTYHKVIDVIPAKACVRVTNAAGLNYNDKVMLIQMKGASINTNSNSSSFGDTTSLNNAGNYEIGTVCHVIGDSVFLVFMLLNQYTIADKVQLVKIPQYISADVTDTLKAASWDNTTGTGGVLAISVEEDLTLNAPIYADSSGFRGGAYRLSDGSCTNFSPADAYAYNANTLTPQNGAFKGEGIADVSTAQSGGRGAPANGGGGGNNHNNAGGGGANLSAGGIGGGNSSSAGCTTTLQGGGGKALSSHGGNKIFLGGGGGAGQANNGVVNPIGGGNGGGLIFIETKNLLGNNKISANGQRGGRAAGDGASGGGGAGTIIINAANYPGSVTIEANGGIGGAEDNGVINGRCYGSGGGGSGGAIYFTGTIPPVSVTVNGGNAGAETRRSATCNAAVPALPGTAGQIISNYTYSSSLILESSYCALLLPVELVWFKAIYKNDHVALNWKIAQPETAERFIVERSGDGSNWIQISNKIAVDGITVYQDIDLSPLPKTNFYRLKMIDKYNAVNYSAIQKVFFPSKNEVIKIYPNPAGKKVFVTGYLPALTEISLFDLSGKLLLRKKVITNQNITEIDLQSLSAGVYALRIGDVVKRLVIR